MTSAEAIGIVVAVIGTVTLPLCLFMWNNRISFKKSLDDKHEENMEKFRVLLYDHQQHPPHSHIETEGPLMAEGIYPQKTKH